MTQPTSWRKEVAVIASAHCVALADLKGPCRSRTLVRVRREIWAMLRQRGWSLCRIGTEFNRDHSTVLHGLRSHVAKAKDARVMA